MGDVGLPWQWENYIPYDQANVFVPWSGSVTAVLWLTPCAS